MTEDEIRAAEHDVTRATYARDILENPLFAEAFEHIERTLVARWRSTAPLDIDGRERAFTELRLVHAVRGYFSDAIGAGKVAQERISWFERMKEAASQFF